MGPSSKTLQNSGLAECQAISKILHPTLTGPLTRCKPIFFQWCHQVLCRGDFSLEMLRYTCTSYWQHRAESPVEKISRITFFFYNHVKQFWCIMKSEGCRFQASLCASHTRIYKLQQVYACPGWCRLRWLSPQRGSVAVTLLGIALLLCTQLPSAETHSYSGIF